MMLLQMRKWLVTGISAASLSAVSALCAAQTIDEELQQLDTAAPQYLWVSDKLSFKSGSNRSAKSDFAGGGEYFGKNRWGITGSFVSNDTGLFGEPDNSESVSVNIKRQLLRSKDASNYLAVGFGWQAIEIENDIDAKGLSFSLLGKMNVANSLQLYGSSAWFPELDSSLPQDNVTGYKLEAGLLFKARSRLSLRAGVKVLDLDNRRYGYDRASSSSFLLGTHLTF